MKDGMYAVLCESEKGLDAFGNPKGDPILMESTGDGLDWYAANERALSIRSHGKYGRCYVVKLMIVDTGEV